MSRKNLTPAQKRLHAFRTYRDEVLKDVDPWLDDSAWKGRPKAEHNAFLLEADALLTELEAKAAEIQAALDAEALDTDSRMALEAARDFTGEGEGNEIQDAILELQTYAEKVEGRTADLSDLLEDAEAVLGTIPWALPMVKGKVRKDKVRRLLERAMGLVDGARGLERKNVNAAWRKLDDAAGVMGSIVGVLKGSGVAGGRAKAPRVGQPSSVPLPKELPVGARKFSYDARYSVFLGRDGNFDYWGNPDTGWVQTVGAAEGTKETSFGDARYWYQFLMGVKSVPDLLTNAGRTWWMNEGQQRAVAEYLKGLEAAEIAPVNWNDRAYVIDVIGAIYEDAESAKAMSKRGENRQALVVISGLVDRLDAALAGSVCSRAASYEYSMGEAAPPDTVQEWVRKARTYYTQAQKLLEDGYGTIRVDQAVVAALGKLLWATRALEEGCGLTRDVVRVTPPVRAVSGIPVKTFIDILVSSLTQWDVKESKKRGYNIYALGLYLGAVEKVREDTAGIEQHDDGYAMEVLARSLAKQFDPAFPPVKKVIKQIEDWTTKGVKPKFPVSKKEYSASRKYVFRSAKAGSSDYWGGHGWDNSEKLTAALRENSMRAVTPEEKHHAAEQIKHFLAAGSITREQASPLFFDMGIPGYMPEKPQVESRKLPWTKVPKLTTLLDVSSVVRAVSEAYPSEALVYTHKLVEDLVSGPPSNVDVHTLGRLAENVKRRADDQDLPPLARKALAKAENKLVSLSNKAKKREDSTKDLKVSPMAVPPDIAWALEDVAKAFPDFQSIADDAKRYLIGFPENKVGYYTLNHLADRIQNAYMNVQSNQSPSGRWASKTLAKAMRKVQVLAKSVMTDEEKEADKIANLPPDSPEKAALKERIAELSLQATTEPRQELIKLYDILKVASKQGEINAVKQALADFPPLWMEKIEKRIKTLANKKIAYDKVMSAPTPTDFTVHEERLTSNIEICKVVGPFASPDAFRTGLNRVEIIDWGLPGEKVAAATDGHRLAVVPVANSIEVTDLNPKTCGPGDEGTFPDIQQVIPSRNSRGYSTGYIFRAEDLIKFFSYATYGTGYMNQLGTLKFVSVNGSPQPIMPMTVEVPAYRRLEFNGPIGQAFGRGHVLHQGELDEGFAIGFNHRFWLDALKTAGKVYKGNVLVSFGDGLSPGRIDREDGQLHIIMPMRLD